MQLRTRGSSQAASSTQTSCSKGGLGIGSRRMSVGFIGKYVRRKPSGLGEDAGSMKRTSKARAASELAVDDVNLASGQEDNSDGNTSEGMHSEGMHSELGRDEEEEALPSLLLHKAKTRNLDSQSVDAGSVSNVMQKSASASARWSVWRRSSRRESVVSGRFAASARTSTNEKRKKRKKTTCDALCDLYAMRSVPLEDFLDGKLPRFSLAVSSISERAFLKYVAPTGAGATAAAGPKAGSIDDVQHFWQHQTQRQCARLYPSMWRVASDNYDPLPVWRMGVQMAALNYQTNDLPLQLNRAFFRRGGGTGFVRKPVEMRICPDDCTGVLGDATRDEDSLSTEANLAAVPKALQGSTSAKGFGAVAAAAMAASLGRSSTGTGGPASKASRWRMSTAVARASIVTKGATDTHTHTHTHHRGSHGSGSCRHSGGTTPRSKRVGSLATKRAVPAATPHWPPARETLSLVEIQMLGLYHLPTSGESRPSLQERFHQHVAELSGVHAPPTCGSLSMTGACLSVHELGGFAAIAPSVEELKRSGDTSPQDKKSLKVASSVMGGLCVTFNGARAFCLVAEPWECLLRVGVQDGESEVAYEAMVIGALRPGYRCVPLRVPATGRLIQGCALLVRISIDAAPSEWIDNHDTLRKKIIRQQQELDERAKTIAHQAKELAKLRKIASQAPRRRSISRQKTTTIPLSTAASSDKAVTPAPRTDTSEGLSPSEGNTWRVVGEEDEGEAAEDSGPQTSESATSEPEEG